MLQMPLPIQIDARPTIVGCPIISNYFDEHLRQCIEVVGGRLAGSEYIYLVHLDRPLHRVQHYLGSTKDLFRRKQQHKRKHPRFCFTPTFFQEGLSKYGIDQQIIEALEPLRGRVFNRYHTLKTALINYAGEYALIYEFIIMAATKQHNANGILMAANRGGIPWRIVRVFQANRKLEQTLKQQKHSFRRLCPACQGVDMPF